MDAGSHLAAITRILEKDFPLVSDSDLKPRPQSNTSNPNGNSNVPEADLLSPTTLQTSLSDADEDSDPGTPFSEAEPLVTITTLSRGAFAGLPFPNASARANALHVVREHISTYLITHPHLDHMSGFVINTAAFHNTSRPKRLAALPSTVDAIKTHIFNNVIWPNLTDEEGGVGLVTFQRLAEGGNIALGEGSGRGFIEVCDGLGVKGYKVSHGHCMRVPGHTQRGSNATIPDTPGISRAATHHLAGGDPREGRSLSFSLPTQSAPGTPGFGNLPDPGRRASGHAAPQVDYSIVDSTAYFIRAESTLSTPRREVLIFGDVEPDSLSLSPRTAVIWAEAAPKIAAGILTGIFIEVSYTNAQGDAVLFGHLAPRHLLQELQNLAAKVKESKKEYETAKEEARKGRKRKRASRSDTVLEGGGIQPLDRRARTIHMTKGIDTPLGGMTDDEMMTDFSRGNTGTHTPLPASLHGPTASNTTTTNLQPDSSNVHAARPSAPSALSLATVSVEHNKAMLAAAFDAPLKGVKVVVIHVKDSMSDGPLVGDKILEELQEGESVLQSEGRALGCAFEISRCGESYWF